MRQRVAIARALAPEPDVLLLDEPFGALDAQTRRAMQDFLLTLWRRTRATVLFVTHDIPEAIYLGSRVIVLASHPGRVIAEIDVPFGAGHGPEITRDSALPRPARRDRRPHRLRLIRRSGQQSRSSMASARPPHSCTMATSQASRPASGVAGATCSWPE